MEGWGRVSVGSGGWRVGVGFLSDQVGGASGSGFCRIRWVEGRGRVSVGSGGWRVGVGFLSDQVGRGAKRVWVSRRRVGVGRGRVEEHLIAIIVITNTVGREGVGFLSDQVGGGGKDGYGSVGGGWGSGFCRIR